MNQRTSVTLTDDNSQHYLFLFNFWVEDVDVRTFFNQILGDSDACRLPAFTNATTVPDLVFVLSTVASLEGGGEGEVDCPG